MQKSSFKVSRRAGASCCAALSFMLAMTLGILSWPGAARALSGKPLAYVMSADGITVIDTGNNAIVDPVPCCTAEPVFPSPYNAVSPDGKYIYEWTGLLCLFPTPDVCRSPGSFGSKVFLFDAATNELMERSCSTKVN